MFEVIDWIVLHRKHNTVQLLPTLHYRKGLDQQADFAPFSLDILVGAKG